MHNALRPADTDVSVYVIFA